jgi:hypothetical protein
MSHAAAVAGFWGHRNTATFASAILANDVGIGSLERVNTNGMATNRAITRAYGRSDFILNF